MALLKLENMDTEDLRKRLVSLISIDDWTDECLKCGYPKTLHKDLHRSAACNEERKTKEELYEVWCEYRK